MRTIGIVLCGLLAATSICGATSASAAVLLAQPAPPNFGGARSSGSIQAFEDFSLTSDATVLGVNFWSQSFGVETQSFEI